VTSPYSKIIMALPNIDCAHDCDWRGGSRFAYRNVIAGAEDAGAEGRRPAVPFGEQVENAPVSGRDA
jgi:hypothetical protein